MQLQVYSFEIRDLLLPRMSQKYILVRKTTPVDSSWVVNEYNQLNWFIFLIILADVLPELYS